MGGGVRGVPPGHGLRVPVDRAGARPSSGGPAWASSTADITSELKEVPV
jgi:hypothetical protein